MGQKISDIFFQYRDFKSRYPGFFSKSGFCPCQFGTGFLVPGYRKPKNVSPCPPYITIALRRVPRGTLFLGSQEIPVAKKCPPLFYISAGFVFVPNGDTGKKRVLKNSWYPGFFSSRYWRIFLRSHIRS